MKTILAILMLVCLSASAQPSYWFQNFERQGNAQLAQQYFFRSGSNVYINFTNPYVYINATGGGGTNAGPPGPPGPQGPAGTNGVNGTNGLPGLNGTNGVNGTNGLNGANGTNTMTVSTNGVLVLSSPVTNLDFGDGTNIHWAATYTGSTVNIRADLTGTVAHATSADLAPDGFGLASTNFVLDAIGGVSQFAYFTSVTNTGALAGKTNNYQAWALPNTTVVTQSFANLVAGAYIRQMVTTQFVSRVLAGPSSVASYAYRTGGAGTISIHYELYMHDSVSNTLIQLASSAPNVVSSVGIPVESDFSLSVAATFIATNASHLVIACKVDQTGTGPAVLHLVNGVSGDIAYDAHANFLQNASDLIILGTQVVGPVAQATVASFVSQDPLTNRVYGTNILNLGITTNAAVVSPGPVTNIAAFVNGALQAFGASVFIVVQPSSIGIQTNQNATFTCIADGLRPITYQWRSNSVNLADAGVISGTTTSNLTFTAAVTNNSATNLTCLVSNYFGMQTSSVVTLTVTNAPGITNVTQGLYAWWKFDDGSGTTPVDSWTNGFNATFVNTPVWTNGIIGGALYFDAAGSQNLGVLGMTNLAFPAGTVTWWIKQAAAYNSGTVRGMWKEFGSGANEFSAQVFSDNGWYVGWYAGAGGDQRLKVVAGPTDWPQNTWIHYAFTWDSAAGCNLYTNGVLFNHSGGNPTPADFSPNHFLIGYAGAYYTGFIDDFRIYTNVLSASQIGYLYHQWYAQP